ncbi:MAG: UvrD-helicase domain-containing protein [Pirellulales bacterium]
MNTLQYTSEQSAALTTWSESVALSAGAGCGKTFVLTRRFLSHLDPHDAAPNVKLGELVAITFTDAAARELRDRVRRECVARLQDPANQDPGAWLTLLRSLDSARISTIHSLCSRLIRSHAVELGLDPTFRVSDAAASAVLEIEAVDDVLRDLLSRRDDDVMRLAADYGLSLLKTMIGDMLPKTRLAEFAGWSEKPPADTVKIWEAVLYSVVLPQNLNELSNSPAVREILQLLEELPFGVPLKPALAAARDMLLERLPRLADFAERPDELRAVREAAKVQGICTKKDWPDDDCYQAYTAACKSFRDDLDKILKLEFHGDIAAIAAENGLRLMRVSSQVAAAYEQAKRDQAAIDYDDLLFHAHRLLSDERFVETRTEWQKQVRLLLVDEFQDTDQVQVDIVKALVGDGLASGGLFFVGDFKQSIYRFRGAEPRVFEALTEEVPAGGRLLLTTNFRSQPAILDFVNALFGRVWPDKYKPLVPQRSQTTPRPAVEFLWTAPAGPETAEPGKKTKINMEALRREEAKRIAQRLTAMIDDGEPIVAKDGPPRPVQRGDIVILFRALSDVQFYEKALEEAGIDYYLVGGHAFYSQQEVFDVLNLLRAVSSSCDDVSLAGVLRSPFFSLADETLFWLVERYGSLNAAIAAGTPPRELESAEREKFSAAVETIHELRRLKEIASPAVVLQTALDRTGYDAVLLAEFLGERKLANLHKLLEQARATEQVAGGGFEAFLEQLTEFTTRDPKEALAATNPESADVVRLMTVHMAKGLEFPVVVVADLDRELAIRWPAATFDPQLGPLVKLPAFQEDRSAVGRDLYQRIHMPEEVDELNRLFYVACTRAADYLVLSAAAKDLDAPTGAWLKLLGQHFELRTGAFLGVSPNEPLARLSQIEAAGIKHQRDAREDLLKLVAQTELLIGQGNGEVPPAAHGLAADRAMRQRFSVTQLSGKIVRHDGTGADADGPRAEAAGGGKWLDPLGFGTLVHAVLERARFGQKNPVRDWCELLAPLHMDDDESTAATKAEELVEKFLASPRCAELVSAASVKREIEFLLRWPLDANSPDAQFLQGYIDCIYRDAVGAWHLLDFKTNRVEGKDLSQVAEQYKMQLGVYALAIEQSLGVRPAKLVLHFLRPSKEHHFSWDEASRASAIAQINQAIADAMSVIT